MKFLALIPFLFLTACGSGLGEEQKESTTVVNCTLEGSGNVQNCNNDGSSIEQQIEDVKDDEETDACCECFGNDEDGLDDETCLVVTQCSELFFEVAKDAEKRELLCPGNALGLPPEA